MWRVFYLSFRQWGETRRPRASVYNFNQMARKNTVVIDQQRQWMAQWKKAASALEAQRARELCEMTEEQAAAATEALLDLALSVPLHPSRETHSGLVDLHSYLKKHRPQ